MQYLPRLPSFRGNTIYCLQFPIVCLYTFTVPEEFSGVQANATAYYGSVHVNATNGTIVFSFRSVIDLRQFDNGSGIIEVVLTQSNFTGTRLFSFSNYQQQRHFSISKHGGINITLITNRIVVYDDHIIYNGYEHDTLSNVKLPSAVELHLNVATKRNNSDDTEEHTPFAVATVAIIQDPPQGYFCNMRYVLKVIFFFVTTVNRTWCLSDIDDTWSIEWPSILNSSSTSQPCPGINTTGIKNHSVP